MKTQSSLQLLHLLAAKRTDKSGKKEGLTPWEQKDWLASNLPAREGHRKRLKIIGFAILPDNHEGMPTGNQVTAEEFDEMANEAEAEFPWDLPQAGRMFIEEGLDLTDPENSYLRHYKDSWIKGNATTIRVTARRYNLPPELLAGVTWTEVGGKPFIVDNLRIYQRNFVPFTYHPHRTSVGDIQIQGRHVADLYGINPDTIDKDRMLLMHKVLTENRALNLDIVARHIDALRQKAFPDSKNHLTQDQINALGWMYNAGYKEEVASDPSIILEGDLHERSQYGIDLLAKWDRMTTLLSQKEN